MTKKRTAVTRVSGNKDLRHGKGTITYTDGSSFTGTWKEDNKSHGILTMPNETKYIGSFFDNKYSGAGKLYLDNGRIIEGQFYNGSLQEHGKITFPNGDVFVGQIDDYMIGKSGVLTYKNGDQYDGTFVEENRSGFGILIATGSNSKATHSINENIHKTALHSPEMQVNMYVNLNFYASNIDHEMLPVR